MLGVGQPQSQVLGSQSREKWGPHKDSWSPLPMWALAGSGVSSLGQMGHPALTGSEWGWS